MVTNQKMVLICLYWAGKEMSIVDICKNTGLNRTQVYSVIQLYKKIGFINIRRIETTNWGDVFIPNKIFISLRNPKLTETTLKKKGLI